MSQEGEGRIISEKEYSIVHQLYDSITQEHMHDGLEIVYIVNGTGEHIIDGKRYYVKQGSIVVVNVGQTHSFSAIDNFEYYNLLFNPAFLSEKYNGLKSMDEVMKKMGYEVKNRPVIDINDTKNIKRIMKLILSEYTNRDKNCDEISKKYIEILINYLARHLRDNKEDSAVDKYAEISDVLIFIDQNLERKITLEEVGEKFGYSPKYFSRVLKRKYNLTFKELLLKKRISKAIKYLMTTDDNIDNISKQCGFTNLTFFYKKFEEYLHISPKYIREYSHRYGEISKFLGKYLGDDEIVTMKIFM